MIAKITSLERKEDEIVMEVEFTISETEKFTRVYRFKHVKDLRDSIIRRTFESEKKRVEELINEENPLNSNLVGKEYEL